MNVIENPMMNIIEFSKTVRKRDESFSRAFSCSSDAPEMIEIYPGTRGRTQGDRNETRPAMNAVKTETLSIELGQCSTRGRSQAALEFVRRAFRPRSVESSTTPGEKPRLHAFNNDVRCGN